MNDFYAVFIERYINIQLTIILNFDILRLRKKLLNFRIHDNNLKVLQPKCENFQFIKKLIKNNENHKFMIITDLYILFLKKKLLNF